MYGFDSHEGNIICVLLINATKCLKLIEELNILHLRYYTKVLPDYYNVILHVLLIIALYIYTRKIHGNRHLVLYVCMYVCEAFSHELSDY